MASKALSSGLRALTAPIKTTSTAIPTRSAATTTLRKQASQFPRPTTTTSSLTKAPARRFSTSRTHRAHSIPRPTTAAKPKALSQPSYELTFTCVPCGTRSAHNVSKQGYHHGSVLITCPSCRNRHIISDHLCLFGDKKVTVEDLMRDRGRLVKRGTLGEDGDIEFWEDGTTTSRDERQGDGEGMDPKVQPRQDAQASYEGSAPGHSFGKQE